MRYNNQYLHDVINNHLLEDQRCFIVGGGPSLEAFDYTLLKDDFWIGINKGFLHNPPLNFSNDMIFNDMMHKPQCDPDLQETATAWKNYQGYKVFREQLDRKFYMNGECLVKQILQPCVSFELNKGIYCGNNSGIGAVMLATALGANPVFLLGFDMKVRLSDNGYHEEKTHWHKGYTGQTPRQLMRKMEHFKTGFGVIAPLLDEKGVRVINLGPDSDLKCFPEQDFKEFFST